MNTEDLIKQLSNDAADVTVLRPPLVRASVWVLLSVASVVIAVWVFGLRPDIKIKLSEWRFVSEQFLTILTAVMAAYGAFCAVVPGRHKALIYLPFVPLVLWVSVLGYGCFLDSTATGEQSAFLIDWMCFPAIVMVGALPAMAMVFMLLRGAPMYPRLAVALGGLAAAAAGNFGLRFFHMVDAGLLVLIWQFGSVVLLSIIAGCCGHWIHNWTSVTDELKTA